MTMHRHIVLLGDSIFDNHAYTGGEPDVASCLRQILPQGWRVTLRAVDGNTTADLPAQARGMPADASHLVVSIGGNDALGNLNLLTLPVESTSEALEIFAEHIQRFQSNYANAMEAVLKVGLPTTICTIYNGNFSVVEGAKVLRAALMMYNDVILNFAIQHRLQVIDLRMVCTKSIDYANPIEPSGVGGCKIALAIAHAAGGRDASTKRNEIWGAGDADLCEK